MQKKIFLSLILILFLILGLTGCNNSKKTNYDLTLEYLNNLYSNYNDTFTYINCSYDLFPDSNDKCYFKSKKYDKDITVYISKENGTYIFEDNYFKLYMMDDANKYFYDISNKYIESSVKVRFDNSLLPSNLNNNSSFSDLINSGKSDIGVYFISNSSFSQNEINLILNEIASNQIMGTFKFIQTNDSKMLAEYSISDIVNNYSKYVILEKSYTINSNFEINETS